MMMIISGVDDDEDGDDQDDDDVKAWNKFTWFLTNRVWFLLIKNGSGFLGTWPVRARIKERFNGVYGFVVFTWVIFVRDFL